MPAISPTCPKICHNGASGVRIGCLNRDGCNDDTHEDRSRERKLSRVRCDDVRQDETIEIWLFLSNAGNVQAPIRSTGR